MHIKPCATQDVCHTLWEPQQHSRIQSSHQHPDGHSIPVLEKGNPGTGPWDSHSFPAWATQPIDREQLSRAGKLKQSQCGLAGIKKQILMACFNLITDTDFSIFQQLLDFLTLHFCGCTSGKHVPMTQSTLAEASNEIFMQGEVTVWKVTVCPGLFTVWMQRAGCVGYCFQMLLVTYEIFKRNSSQNGIESCLMYLDISFMEFCNSRKSLYFPTTK